MGGGGGGGDGGGWGLTRGPKYFLEYFENIRFLRKTIFLIFLDSETLLKLNESIKFRRSSSKGRGS